MQLVSLRAQTDSDMPLVPLSSVLVELPFNGADSIWLSLPDGPDVPASVSIIYIASSTSRRSGKQDYSKNTVTAVRSIGVTSSGILEYFFYTRTFLLGASSFTQQSLLPYMYT